MTVTSSSRTTSASALPRVERRRTPLFGEGKTSVAVVGYGYWGSKHVRVLSGIPDVAVTIVDADPARLVEASKVFPAARLVLNMDDVSATVDAAIIATPPASHAGLALDAIAKGHHVLVEKPLAVSVEDCEAMIAAADAAGVSLMVGHTFEHNAAVWKLRELIDSGELGDLCYIDTARLNLGLYQTDVNVIWDLAAHDVSIINFLLGRLPDAVSAWGHGHARLNVEDVGYVQLRYTHLDVMAYIHVSWLDPCKVRRVTVVGTKKMAVYNDMSVSERIRIYDVGVDHGPHEDSMHAMPLSYRYGDIVSPYLSASEPLTVQDSHFIECVRTGAAPRVDGHSGLATVRVLEATDRALRTRTEAMLGGAIRATQNDVKPHLIPAQGRRRFGTPS